MNAGVAHHLPDSSSSQEDYLKILDLAPFIETIGVRCKIIELTKNIINSSDKIYELITSMTLLEEEGEIKSHRITVTPSQSYLIVEYP